MEQRIMIKVHFLFQLMFHFLSQKDKCLNHFYIYSLFKLLLPISLFYVGVVVIYKAIFSVINIKFPGQVIDE